VFILLLFFSKNFETGKLYTEIVQKRLNEAGITDEEGKPLLEDGIYGEKTKKAHEKAIKIKQFEDENSGVMYGGKSGISENERIKKDIAATTTALSAGDYYEDKLKTTENWTAAMDYILRSPNVFQNPKSVAEQRTFWYIASPVFLKNCPLSLQMLHHSLQDNPGEFTENNFRASSLENGIEEVFIRDDGFIEWIYETSKATNDKGTITIDSKNRPQFTSDDLKRSIHGTTGLNVTRTYLDSGDLKFNVTIRDVYDFTEFMWVDRLKEHGVLAVAANDAAYLSQKSGAIQPYDVNIAFSFAISEEELKNRYLAINEKKVK